MLSGGRLPTRRGDERATVVKPGKMFCAVGGETRTGRMQNFRRDGCAVTPEYPCEIEHEPITVKVTEQRNA